MPEGTPIYMKKKRKDGCLQTQGRLQAWGGRHIHASSKPIKISRLDKTPRHLDSLLLGRWYEDQGQAARKMRRLAGS